RRSGLDWIFTERVLDDVIRPILTMAGNTIRGVYFPLEWGETDGSVTENLQKIIDVHDALTDAEPCVLQHSSGTTGLQKPVMLSHKAILDHVKSYGQALQLREEDKIVSWLPLYHDMGL